MAGVFQPNVFQPAVFQEYVSPLMGGVGHYKLDLLRARQLAKMERKIPPPLDLRTQPSFKPVGSPPIAPMAPAPQVAAAPNQRAGEAAAQAQAAIRRKRDIEAILLLAC